MMPDASTAYGKILELANDDKFTAFQNSVTSAVYDELGQGYAANENEVALVKRLVEATQNQSYNNSVKLHAAMLHGSRSYVEFDYLDKRVTKELGDMAVIAVVTTSKKRLFQRICIIQNKKTRKNGWDIDLEQLFLLKNFPPFTGSKGIFSGYRDLAFRNSSGSLGAFGLMHAPGEMLVVAAPLLPEFLRGKKNGSTGGYFRGWRAFGAARISVLGDGAAFSSRGMVSHGGGNVPSLRLPNCRCIGCRRTQCS